MIIKKCAKKKSDAIIALPVSIAVGLIVNAVFGKGIGLIAFAIAYSSINRKDKLQKEVIT